MILVSSNNFLYYCITGVCVSILGMTLVAIACASPLMKDLYDHIKYLIEETKADCRIVDGDMNTMVSYHSQLCSNVELLVYIFPILKILSTNFTHVEDYIFFYDFFI